LFINFCLKSLLKTGTDFYRTEQQIQRDVCEHSTCRSTMPAHELSANYSEKKWPPNTQRWTPCRYRVWGERCTKLSESFMRSQIQFLN